MDVATIMLTRSGHQMTDERRERLTKQIMRVTKKNLSDALRIEYRLRYAMSRR